jgi:hypothetical protein
MTLEQTLLFLNFWIQMKTSCKRCMEINIYSQESFDKTASGMKGIPQGTL